MRIILFDIDCLRPDHLGCYGYTRPTSPAIDAIASEGVRFTRYFCANSPCLPSRTGWASGRFGIRNGVVSNLGAGADFRLKTNPYVGPKAENEMLMRKLRAHNWDTISVSNFADRHNAFYFMCGWSEFHTPNLLGGFETSEQVNEVALNWLRKNGQRDNYLLHINYWDAHRPYRMDKSWADRFKDHPVEQKWPDDSAIQTHQDIKGPFTAHAQFKDDISLLPLMPGCINDRRDFEHMLTGYDASIAYVDYHISVIIKELEALGLMEDTAIIVTSDHGDAFGEHGIYSDHVCADECIHHIPLIVRWPGETPKNHESDAMLYNIDLSATLCDLLNIETPEDWDGESFKSQVRGDCGGGHDYLVWDHGLYSVQRAVRTREHLFLRTYDDFGYQLDPVELYEIEKDPYQTRNIAGDNKPLVEKYTAMMNSWVDTQLHRSQWAADPLMEILRERN